MCTRKRHQKAPDLRKHCAQGRTRTGLQPLNIRQSPENLANPAQSDASTTRSEAPGLHIVHTLLLAHFGAPNQATLTAVRAWQLCHARDFAPNGRADLRNRTVPEQAPHYGAALILKIDEHHGSGFLLSEHLMDKRTATCMTNPQASPPRSEHAPPTAKRRPPQGPPFPRPREGLTGWRQAPDSEA